MLTVSRAGYWFSPRCILIPGNVAGVNINSKNNFKLFAKNETFIECKNWHIIIDLSPLPSRKVIMDLKRRTVYHVVVHSLMKDSLRSRFKKSIPLYATCPKRWTLNILAKYVIFLHKNSKMKEKELSNRCFFIIKIYANFEQGPLLLQKRLRSTKKHFSESTLL